MINPKGKRKSSYIQSRDINGNIIYLDPITGKEVSRVVEQGTTLQASYPIKKLLMINLNVQKKHNERIKSGQSVMIRGKEVRVTPNQTQVYLSTDERPLSMKDASKLSYELDYKLLQLDKAVDLTTTALGNFSNYFLPSTYAGALVDKLEGKNSFSGSLVEGNNGLGGIGTNLVFDLASPLVLGKGFNLLNNGYRILNKGISSLIEARPIIFDVVKSNARPWNWRNYRFLGDRRFFNDLNKYGSGTVLYLRQQGNYPLTFTERRNFVSDFKNSVMSGIDYARNEAVENLKTPLNYVYSLNDINPKSYFGTKISTKIAGETPFNGNYHAFYTPLLDELYFPFRDGRSTLMLINDIDMSTPLGRKGIGAHEFRHAILTRFKTPLTTYKNKLEGSYNHYVNPNLPYGFKSRVDSYITDAGTKGEWKGSLDEMDAELTKWGALYGIPSKYSLMSAQLKAKVYNLFLDRFGGSYDPLTSDTRSILLRKAFPGLLLSEYKPIPEIVKKIDNSKVGEILQGLEILGYRKQGGKMNMLQFLKNGDGISKNGGKNKKATSEYGNSGGYYVQGTDHPVGIDASGNVYDQVTGEGGPVVLDEVTVSPEYAYLYTWRPLVDGNYRLTGHSQLHTISPIHIISNYPDLDDYNLFTNNCSDATRRALEKISGKRINPFLFTTPGDVKDFAEDELGGITSYNKVIGRYTTKIPINQKQKAALLDLTEEGYEPSLEEKNRRMQNAILKAGRIGGLAMYGIDIGYHIPPVGGVKTLNTMHKKNKKAHGGKMNILQFLKNGK